MDQSLVEQGKSLARKEAEKSTTIALEGSKEDGATVSVTSAHEGENVSWGITAWFRRKFQRGGSSGGVKGEIKF